MEESKRKKKAVNKTSAGGKTAERKISEGKTEEEQAGKKRLAEMNLLDDFLFGSMVTYPEIGEQFVRILLKVIFGREFKHLSVTAQKVFYGSDADRHGARLDVYLEPEIEDFEECATVYDMEPDRNDSMSEKRMLPRRVRFYHAKIAARSLNSGEDYDKLKNVIIIMIMPYDPFNQGHMVYTVKNRCLEIPNMEYEDGASTLFLYTKGTQGVPNEGLKQLLYYMEESTGRNAVNEDLIELHGMVETVKNDPEVIAKHMIGYLKIQEERNRMRKEVIREVREELLPEVQEEVRKELLPEVQEEVRKELLAEVQEEVRKELLAEVQEEVRKELLVEVQEEVRKKSLAEGWTAGEATGDLRRLISLICKKLRKDKSLKEIAEDLEEEVSVVEPIYNAAKDFAPEYDPELVFDQMSKDK